MQVHTLKCMHAAGNIVSLVTIPSIFVKQTPFATCSIATAVAAHGAACSGPFSPEQIAPVKDRIRLCLGMARTLGEVWPFAEARFQEAKATAQGVFSPPKPAQNSSDSGVNLTPQSSNSQTLSIASGTFELPIWTNNEAFFPPRNNITLADIGYTLLHPTVWDGEDFLNRNWFVGGSL